MWIQNMAGLAGEEPKPIGGLPQRKRGATAPLTRCVSPPKPDPWLARFRLIIFLRSSPSPRSAVTYFVRRGQIAIAWAHCDPAGIVFNGRFFEFFDHSTWLMFEEVCWRRNRTRSARASISLAFRSIMAGKSSHWGIPRRPFGANVLPLSPVSIVSHVPRIDCARNRPDSLGGAVVDV